MTHEGIPNTHDGTNQVIRFASYINAFYDGHFPPRWAGELNYSYGIPVLNFFYPLPGYIAAVLSVTNLSLEAIFKIISAFAFVLSPVGVYLTISLFRSKSIAFLSGLLYSLAPYQLLNLYVRGDIGETISLSILPFVLFFCLKGLQIKNIRFTALGGFLSALVILAHHGIGLMAAPLILTILIYFLIIKPTLLRYVGVFVLLWFGISGFFWIPALLEQKYTLASFFIGRMYQEHFLSFPKVIISEWRFGPDVNLPGGQSPQIGLLSFVLFCISLLMTYRKKITMIPFIFLMFSLLSLFLTLPISSNIWSHIEILQKYQFPWRFLALTTLTISVCVGFFFPFKNKVIIGCISLLLIANTILYTKTNGYSHQDNSWYKNFPSTTFFHGEALTVWSEGEASSYPAHPIEVIGGSAVISGIYKKTQKLEAIIDAKTPSNIKVNTLFYPGWKVYIDETPVAIQFQDSNNRGLITFSIPEGRHKLRVVFTETKLRLFSDIITIASLLLLIGILYKPNMLHYFHHE